MITALSHELTLALQLFNESNARIIWNTFLALIPCLLSFWLFRSESRPSWFWWPVFGLFIAFLPNAPYVLTDSIHIWELSHRGYHFWSLIVILLPQYMVFIGLCFQAYAIALAKLETYYRAISFSQEYQLLILKGVIHGLCIIGIYLGRFERFNSWDLLNRPEIVFQTTLLDLINPANLMGMIFGLVIIWLLSEYVMIVNRKLILGITKLSSN